MSGFGQASRLLMDYYTREGEFLEALHYHRVDVARLPALLDFVSSIRAPREDVALSDAYLWFDLASHISRSAELMRSASLRSEARRAGAPLIARLQDSFGTPWSRFDFESIAVEPGPCGAPAFWGFPVAHPGRDVDRLRSQCPSLDLVDRELQPEGFLGSMARGVYLPELGPRLLSAVAVFVHECPGSWGEGRSLADALVDFSFRAPQQLDLAFQRDAWSVAREVKRLLEPLAEGPSARALRNSSEVDAPQAFSILARSIESPEGALRRLAAGEVSRESLGEITDALRALVGSRAKWSADVFRSVWNLKGAIDWSERQVAPESRHIVRAAIAEIDRIVPIAA